VTVFLVPVSAAIILAATTNALFTFGAIVTRLVRWGSPERARRLAAGGRTAACVVAGGAIAVSLVAGAERLGRLDTEPRRDAFASLVAVRSSPADLYLIPPRMYELRVDAAVPVYVDYKTHPYEDGEVLEWRRRLREATRIYANRGLDCARLASLARAEGITHVLAESSTRPQCGFLRRRYRGGDHAVYAVGPPLREPSGATAGPLPQ
jgi:hypothetical protein